jgi:hypothetical protein
MYSLITHVSPGYASSSRQRGDRHVMNVTESLYQMPTDIYKLALPNAEKRLANPTIIDLVQKYDGTNPFHAPLDNYKASSPSRY